MSYSFSERAATKDELMVRIKERLGEIVKQQPAHAVDRDQAEETARAFIGILRDFGPGEHCFIHMHGSVSHQDANGREWPTSGVSVSVSASIISSSP